ncbi:MAG: carbohydrate binding family 9 domain-containing protein, partial [Leadbetterella sp.]|nr:carbohydrate binding family 9 domain-containing protein [Leadbetterella sp.]
MRSTLVLIFCVLFLNISEVFSQNNDKEIHVKKTPIPLKLDGNLDDEAWKMADLATSFFQNAPFDTSFAKNQTEVKLTFDDKFLYVGMKAYQPKSAYTVSSLKRDFESGSSDVFSVTIDAFKDKLNGMQFSVSPLNVQREGLISLGTQSDYSWDNKWYSKVKNYDEYWTAEFAIPFTTLRYKVSENSNSWRINFGRFFMQTNESATWSPV